MPRPRTARRIWPWATAVVGAYVLTFILTFVLMKAHDEPKGSDFWSVAVPGALTGFGTLALACVTVWLALGERKRDDQLRTQQRSELAAERQSERDAAQAARDAELAAEAGRAALCIVAICGVRTEPSPFPGHMQDGAVAQVTVVNGSSAPILGVELVTAIASGTEKYGPLSFQPDEEALTATGARWSAIVLPFDSTSFDGAWHRDQGGEKIAADEARFIIGEQVDAVISWTDVRGFKWRRVGYDEPVAMT